MIGYEISLEKKDHLIVRIKGIDLKSNEKFFKKHGLVVRVFTNGPGDLGLIPGHVVPKTLKMVFDTSWLNTQQYKVCIKGRVEQPRERSSALV